MPPKRAAHLSLSPTKKQRTKEQKLGTLDTYFGSPSSSSAKSGAGSSNQIIRATSSTTNEIYEISDDDEPVPQPSTISERNNYKEIIDVDALNDNTVKTGGEDNPSSSLLVGASSSHIQVADRNITRPTFSNLELKSNTSKRQYFLSGTINNKQPIYPTLDVDSVAFSVAECPWDGQAPYSFIAHVLQSVSATRSRISILNILTNALRFIIQHDQTALLSSMYLLSNSLSPPYVPVELGIGPSIISKAIQKVSGLSAAALRRLYTKTGDAGDVAFEARSNQPTLKPHATLTIASVYNSLLKICHSKGEGAMLQKQSIVENLLLAAKGEEVRYLVRTLTQHVRVGAVRTSVLTALARALVLTRPISHEGIITGSPYFAPHDSLPRTKVRPGKGKKKEEDPARLAVQEKFLEAEKVLKQVYVQHPNYDDIAGAILNGGLEGLSGNVTLSIGIPLHHTLGSPTRSLDEVYDRLCELPFTAEFKYDGQRAQIHARRSEENLHLIKIFSRHLEEMTDKYPDITFLVHDFFNDHAEIHSFIIDTEIVAINPTDGELRTFQELSGRPRKDVKLEDIKVNVCVFAFDIMYYNGMVLLEKPFRHRRDILRTKFPPYVPLLPTAARFAHVESCESNAGREVIEEFWQRAVEGRSEGLMIKLLDSGEINDDTESAKGKQKRKPLPATYEPDKRTSAWLKLKKDYVLGLGDSLDLVPVGAWHGNGRKAAWWSPILLAVWDEQSEQFVAVCKCMSGFTDEFYKALNVRYGPEVYFKPQEVWEIRGADITLSPVSVASLGLVSDDRGLSLRFPRFIRLREDKVVSDASTPTFLAGMWSSQESRGKNSKGIDDGELVDISPEASEVEDDEYDE